MAAMVSPHGRVFRCAVLSAPYLSWISGRAKMPANHSSTEQNRRELRGILSRRDFVIAGVTASMGGLLSTACSSDSAGTTTVPPPAPPSPPPSGLQSVTGTVSLPAGSSLKPGAMMVDVMTQQNVVSASGAFTIDISTTGPSLALLLDSGGDGVLMSVFDPSQSTHAVSAHTTAVAMLYYAVSAHVFPAAAMSRILTLLDSDPAMAALELAVSQSVDTDPHALANNAEPLGPAVTQALQTILGTAGSVRGAPSFRQDPIPTLMLLTPSGDQNGVTVSQDATTTSLLISNSKRRPCKAYVYEVTTLTGNVTTDVSPAKLIQGPFDLDSTENLSLFTSLKDFTTFFHGTSPWSPVNLPAILLQLETGTDRTTYQVIVLASALKSVSGDTWEPSFFRDPHFINEVNGWRTWYNTHFYRSVFGDMLLPIFCFFGGFGAIVASEAVIASVVDAAAAANSATFTRIISQLEYGSVGDMTEALANVIRDAITSTTSSQFWKPQIQAVIGQAESRALQAQSTVLTTSRLSKGAKMFLSVFEPIFAAGVILDGFDLGAVILDVFNSDIGSSWTSLLIRQLLNLSPINPTVAAGDRVVFKVSNPANTPGGLFVYDWTQTSLFSTLSAEGEVNVGNTITTSQTTVDLVTTAADATPINVLVIGYDTSSGQRVEIGRAGTVVSFLLPAQITPTGRIASIGDQVVFVVTVGGAVPIGQLTYKWTLTGTAGSIGSSNVVTTSQPAVTWTAQTPGQADNVHVDVFFGTTLIAKADVAVSVAGPPFIDVTIVGTLTGPFLPDSPPPAGHYHFTPGYVGLREVSPGGGGLDGIYMAYDYFGGSLDAGPGVFIAILVPSGANLRAGQVLSKWTEQGNANQFQFDISNNLINPGDPDADLGAPTGTGTLTVNAIGQQTNGEWLMQYTFQVIGTDGGSVSGTGIGKWGANGVTVNA